MPRPDWANEPGGIPETYSIPTSSANYLYPDNSSKIESLLLKKDSIVKDKLGQLKKELKLKNVKLIKYSEYLTDKKARGGDLIENFQINPNRLFWFVEIDAPNGLEIPQKNGEAAKFKKACIVQIFDAETSELFGTDIVEVP
ncbi:hypothetical protein CAL7716_006910 [Calothrix sp. PCC 7716]|nr:hypothetical protein CAL7716_006910 [Calothrix sp. PCC 7716]